MTRIEVAFLAVGLCLSVADAAASRTTNYTYTPEGLVATIDGPRQDVSDVTTFTYHSTGSLATMINALGHVTRYTEYDGAGRLLRMVDPNGLVSSFTYHPRGWMLSQTVGEGADAVATRYDYDVAGNLIEITLPDGVALEFTYDAANRLTLITDAAGNRVRYTLDAMGNRRIEQTEDPLGTVTRTLHRVYNDLNRLEQTYAINPLHTSQYTYDNNGNRVRVIDALNRIQTSSFDALDRLVSVLDPALGQTTYGYDRRDNLTRVTDPRGNSTTYSHNAFDETTTQVSPDTGTTIHTYDEAGNLQSTTDARGVLVTYSYDALNRLTGVSYPDTSLNVTFTYDQGPNAIGRLSGMQDAEGLTRYGYDARGNLASEMWLASTGIETTVLYRYDVAKRLTGVTYPSGREVSYNYDAVGNVSRVSTLFDGQVTVLADNIRYLPFGPASRWISGDGLETVRTFDLDGQLIGLTVGTLIDSTYTPDPVGNIVSIIDNFDPLRSQALTYDALDRLILADGGYGVLGFDYDSVGNRLASTDDAVAATLAYESSSNRLTANRSNEESYEHDAAGNRTALTQADGSGWRYFYRDDGRLQKVTRSVWQASGKGKKQTTQLVEGAVASFGYNGRGERVRKTGSAGTTNFRFGPSGQLLAELESTGAVTREYVYLNGQPLAIATYQPIGGGAVDVIIDNDSVQTSSIGAWTLEYDRKGADYNGSHRLAFGGQGSAYRWTPVIHAGSYEVQAWWVATRKNASQVPFTVRHDGMTALVSVDQTADGGRWISLGAFNFDGSGNEYIEVSDADGRTVADAVRLVGQLQPGGLQSAGIQYLHPDHLGTPQVLTDEFGTVLWQADYRPFGMATVAGDPALQMLRFPGQYYDEETGLHYNYFRDYEPSTGRYIQSDPTGLAGGLNAYAYVSGNPLHYTDPYGLFQWHGNWCGGDWTGGYEKQWGQLTPDEWRNVKGPIGPLDSCCVVHDKAYYDCRQKFSCDADARKECFKNADRLLYRCSMNNSNGGGFDEWGLREYMRRSRPGSESNASFCAN